MTIFAMACASVTPAAAADRPRPSDTQAAKWPLGRVGQLCCMAVLGSTIAVPATGVNNIFTIDMGKADGSAMLSALLDAAGAFSSIGFFSGYDGLRTRFGWAGVLLLLAGLSVWTLLCEAVLLTRDLFKFRRGYVVNPVRTRGSLPIRYQKERYIKKQISTAG